MTAAVKMPVVLASLPRAQKESLQSGDVIRRRPRTHMPSENRMSVRRTLIPLALALLAARCTNGPHPTAGEQPAAPTPHFLRWAGGAAPQFSATGALAGLPGG